MTTLFCVRPATPNIGNDVIGRATAALLREVFGDETNVVDIPALRGPQHGGLTASSVYDMNRLADGVVIGGGNLFENGQLSVDRQALDALRVPLAIVGVSHGRIHGRDGALLDRTDAMPPPLIRHLVDKACVTLVRDRGTQGILGSLGIDGAQVGGCPTLFMAPNPAGWADDGRVVISVRHPARMSVSPALQWRVADDVRRLVRALTETFGDRVFLACHDYADLEFAAAFSAAGLLYFDDVERYVDSLRRCRLNVSYRLHAFLPCLAFGTPSIHLSYDTRGREMVATVAMDEWDVDITRDGDVVDAVLARARNVDRYQALRRRAAATVAGLYDTTRAGLAQFAGAVAKSRA